MPDISYEELSDKLKDEGFDEVKFSTIRTMRNDTLITMRVACEFPMADCAFVLFDRNEWAQYRNAGWCGRWRSRPTRTLDAVGSNSRARAAGSRPARTKSTIRRRNPGE
jgi:hypothetical protein